MSDGGEDRRLVEEAVRTFFDAFTSGPPDAVAARMAALREVLLPQAVVVRTCGGEPTAYDVEGFIAPREAMLTDGTLTEFREWVVEGRTDLYGDVAQHWCTYAKEGVHDGVATSGRGTKSLQLVRTGAGWRISAAAWDDER